MLNEHEMTVGKDGGLWRSSCSCGWRSTLCRSKAAAVRSRFYHDVDRGTSVTSRRSRSPFTSRTGQRGTASAGKSGSTVDAVSGFGKPKMTAARRKTARRRRAEGEVVKAVRPMCVARDGYCRTSRYDLLAASHALGICCRGRSEWAHLGDKKRARTRGMAPEERHTTAGSLMLCGRMHRLYDDGELQIEALTEHGADGRLRFRLGEAVYEEPRC